MNDEPRVDRLVRWTRDELAWGQANAEIHSLGEELKNLTPADPERGDDDLISATDEKFADAVVRVNEYLADLPQGADPAAHGFQRALSIPLRGPGGSHESLSDEDDD
ncbi:hypothetical protein H7I77_13410 [Mycolicibacterium novocastrense]|uniref:Uncharacterized protein n=1 Tax=Mycolicibacterium novocastrense TaxID=59813 RepID=A0AAW5SKL9_MYCNV|nr:hypothetical protein [Mycolicibacterium novocastrense]MCV7024334.1 hypothetical protein [Mycolicibacterium novocastrense]GAT08069.1 uncharacterized protein RMCN_1202 [Mycolicibacterium novocastrense]